MANVYTPSELRWSGIAKETVWGTAVTPTYFIPFKDSKPVDKLEYVDDKGIRGTIAGDEFGKYIGAIQSTQDLSGLVFPDSFGLLLMGMFGADTVTGTSVKTHTFKSVTTTQPPSLTFTDYDGTSIRQRPGTMLEEVTLKWAEKAALEYSCKGQGKPSATTTGITPTLTTTTPFLNWSFAATLGGTADVNITSFELDLKRKITVKYPANNTTSPSIILAGPLSATGKITFEKGDDTELSAALAGTQQALVLTGTQAATSWGITITLTKAMFTDPAVNGKDFVEIDVNYDGIYNSTDGGTCSIALLNGVTSY